MKRGPNNNYDEICGWTDRNTMRKRHQQPHSPTRRATLQRGGKKRGGWVFTSQKRLRVRQCTPRPHSNGLGPTRGPQVQHTPPTPKWVMKVEMQPEAEDGEGGGAEYSLSVEHGCFGPFPFVLFLLSLFSFPLSGKMGGKKPGPC